MYVDLVHNYIRKQMQRKGIVRYDWNEEYIRIKLPGNPLITTTIHQLYTNDYLYLLDKWAQNNVFLTNSDYNIQIISDYAYRSFLSALPVHQSEGINEFTGHVRIRIEFTNPIGNENYLVIPVIVVKPIQLLPLL